MERLYKKLEEYGQSDYYPFHMPGHKRNPQCVNGNFPLERDITEIYGFDELHHAEGVLKEAQEALSRLYGTRESFFSVNGSTAALLTAISASVKKGGRILVARNCHKAVYNGIYLRDLSPIYIYPQSDSKLGINGEISVGRVERSLEENPDIEAVLITSPTYDGVVSDVQSIAEAAHRHGVPLIVDEAHGAHFRYSDYFPVSAVDLGADLVIQSFHKTLPAMTQTAVLHVCSDLVDMEKIKRFLGIYQTSSPSYILMASLDACVDKMESEGTAMFADFCQKLDHARQELGKCRYIRLVPDYEEEKKIKEKSGIFDFDRSKLILTTDHSSLNGPELADLLRNEFHIEVEMVTEHYVLAMATVGDTEEGFRRLVDAVSQIDSWEKIKVIGKREGSMPLESGSSQETYSSNEAQREDSERKGNELRKLTSMKQMMTISEALEADSQSYMLEESGGKISAEFVYLYPPGIPIIVPGEQITGLFIRDVRRYKENGLNLHGLEGEDQELIRVVKGKQMEEAQVEV